METNPFIANSVRLVSSNPAPSPECERIDGRVYEYELLWGVVHGVVRVWSESGCLLAEVETRHGRPHGGARTFHPDGEVDREVSFRAGELSGPVLHLDRDGHVRVLGNFVDGLPEGAWLVRDEDGQALFRALLDHDHDLDRAFALQELLVRVTLTDELVRTIRRLDVLPFASEDADDRPMAA